MGRKKQRGNGQGTAYKRSNGKWQAETCIYIDGMRVRKTKGGFRTKTEALDYISTLKNGTMNFGTQQAPAFDFPLSKTYTLWKETKKYKDLSNSKRTAYKIAWNRLKPLWQRNITSIRLAEYQALFDGLTEGYYPKRDMRGLLSHLYDTAIKHEIIAAGDNKANLIELPTMPTSTKDAFTADEVTAIWEDYNAGNKFTSYALIMIYTGMRVGELYSIKKDNLHLDESYMIGGIKSEAGKNRVIPIADYIMPLLIEVEKESQKGLIDMGKDTFYKQWALMTERAGVRPLKSHSCRHTAATALSLAEVPPAIIIEILGHKDFSTTMGYTHIPIADKVNAINKIKKG